MFSITIAVINGDGCGASSAGRAQRGGANSGFVTGGGGIQKQELVCCDSMFKKSVLKKVNDFIILLV